ncbi:hypothetical protein MANES_14G120121v8 [Manihot esculenta]|uniref:Uncharacterized protein n=1 Tax=Manihot esculenta TaxID=3983 RepID=A0ACB7GI50_MANES|nr:hypothetical protein MANES_14G120121v8 [Manihot esculenta]
MMSRNGFSGSQILGNMSLLESLDLSNNNFSGSIPSSLLKCNEFKIMGVNYNHLSGKIPNWIGNLSQLQILHLSQNNIFGSLSCNFCPKDFTEVHLFKNMLQGLLKDSFHNCPSLVVLDISHNNLIGRISKWIGEIPLSYILLSQNHFEGEIPIQLCNCSSWYEKREKSNQPSRFFNPETGVSVRLMYSSYFYQAIILRYFSGIDLSCNFLRGEIPPEIGNLSMIKVNPITFSNLGQIESLDLSYNNLEGKIPPQLTRLYSLAVFSVAHNNFSGKTSERLAQFATFEGNPLLCGLPLPKSCNNISPLSPATPIEEKEDNDSSAVQIWIFIELRMYKFNA